GGGLVKPVDGPRQAGPGFLRGGGGGRGRLGRVRGGGRAIQPHRRGSELRRRATRTAAARRARTALWRSSQPPRRDMDEVEGVARGTPPGAGGRPRPTARRRPRSAPALRQPPPAPAREQRRQA